MPAFWLGMLLQLFFGVFMKNATDGAFYLPISGAGGSNSEFESWVHYILPAVTLAAVSTAYTARIMRSQLLEVLNQDYIRTAKAKGLSRSAHHLAPRAQERTHPRRHLHRHRLWRHARRRHPHGDGLQLAGRWL